MKSCRTPSTLTEYSSVSPGREKVTSFSVTETVPVGARFLPPDSRPRPTPLATSRKPPPASAVEPSQSPSRVTVPESFWKAVCKRAPSAVAAMPMASPL